MDYLILGAIIMAFTQIFKKIWSPESWVVPIMSIIVSFVLIGVYVFLEKVPASWEMVVIALTLSFTANGMWSSGKAIGGQIMK